MRNELTLRCVMSKETLPVIDAEQAVYALVDIKAAGGAVLGSLSANVALVLDRSGSMDGEKMENMKEAVGYVVDSLKDSDSISVTIFDDQVETLVPSQQAKNREEIKAMLNSVIARGGTQISDGLKAGLAEVMKGYSKDRVNRIVLLTDGQTWDDEDACLAIADKAGKQGIAITSVGLGNDWNEKLLIEMSERSRGNSHWIENPISILDAFRDEVEGVQSVAATNLHVTARMSQGVRPVKVYSTMPMIADVSTRSLQGSTVNAALGILDRRKGQALLIEMRLSAKKEGSFRLGQVEIAYDLPAQNISAKKVKQDLFVAFSADAAAGTKVNAEVMNLVEKLSAFKLQTRALTDAGAGNIAAATRKLQSAATVLLNLGEDELAEAIDQEIATLEKTGTLSAAGTKKLEYGTRRLTQAMR